MRKIWHKEQSRLMRTADDIFEHFVNLLNHWLPRLGMFGGEITAQHILSHVAFIEKRENEFNAHMDALRDRGAFTATGVSGAFSKHTRLLATYNEVGSVYAEIAFKMGYLNVDRILDRSAFETLSSGLRSVCRSRDFNTEDVSKEFGTPSWTSGTNPFFPWVYLYLCNELDHGMIAFDFWNVVCYDEGAEKAFGEFGDLPALRNVRIRGANFAREFTFTPVGRRITKRDSV